MANDVDMTETERCVRVRASGTATPKRLIRKEDNLTLTTNRRPHDTFHILKHTSYKYFVYSKLSTFSKV